MRVGFIGLGTMGSGISANMRKAGHEMVVHDARRQAAEKICAAGAEWADSPKAVAEATEVVFTSLPGPKEFEAVVRGDKGLIAGMSRGQPLFDLTTNSPTVIRNLEPLFAERGAVLLDSPVSGGPAGAHSGKMAIWVGGDEQVFQRYRPVLDAAGDQVSYIGPIGAASVAKLVHNLSGYMIQTALAEAFTMGVKAGVDPLTLWKAVRNGVTGRRRTFDGLADHFLPDVFDPPRFALKLAHKDVSLATQVGREMGVPMRLANLTLEEMTEALARGWEGRDSRSSMILQKERSGLDDQGRSRRHRRRPARQEQRLIGSRSSRSASASEPTRMDHEPAGSGGEPRSLKRRATTASPAPACPWAAGRRGRGRPGSSARASPRGRRNSPSRARGWTTSGW